MQSIVTNNCKNKGKSIAMLRDSRLRTCTYGENDRVRIPANVGCKQISRTSEAGGRVETDEVCRIENTQSKHRPSLQISTLSPGLDTPRTLLLLQARVKGFSIKISMPHPPKERPPHSGSEVSPVQSLTLAQSSQNYV